MLHRGQALAQASGDGKALLWLATNESNALLKLAKFQDAVVVALRGLQAACEAGRTLALKPSCQPPTQPRH